MKNKPTTFDQAVEEEKKKLYWRHDCTNRNDRHHYLCQGCEEIVVLNEEELRSFASTIRDAVREEEKRKVLDHLLFVFREIEPNANHERIKEYMEKYALTDTKLTALRGKNET